MIHELQHQPASYVTLTVLARKMIFQVHVVMKHSTDFDHSVWTHAEHKKMSGLFHSTHPGSHAQATVLKMIRARIELVESFFCQCLQSGELFTRNQGLLFKQTQTGSHHFTNVAVAPRLDFSGDKTIEVVSKFEGEQSSIHSNNGL
jgi:Na+-transporting NADH:ubiquinone oxidoreductase subunit NqrA